MNAQARRLVTAAKIRGRELLAASSIGHLILNQYPFSFSPRQLAILIDLLDSVEDLDGAAVEVGCAWGAGTVYLQRHLQASGRPRAYHCVDTFGGFTAEDVAVERSRGKHHAYDDFVSNSRRLFERTLERNGLAGTTVVHQADAATFDYSTLPQLAFGLVDVDLYRPMLAATRGCWSRLQPGGVLVLDDCGASEKWDGAEQAHREFCAEVGAEVVVIGEKLGVLRRPPAGHGDSSAPAAASL